MIKSILALLALVALAGCAGSATGGVMRPTFLWAWSDSTARPDWNEDLEPELHGDTIVMSNGRRPTTLLFDAATGRLIDSLPGYVAPRVRQAYFHYDTSLPAFTARTRYGTGAILERDDTVRASPHTTLTGMLAWIAPAVCYDLPVTDTFDFSLVRVIREYPRDEGLLPGGCYLQLMPRGGHHGATLELPSSLAPWWARPYGRSHLLLWSRDPKSDRFTLGMIDLRTAYLDAEQWDGPVGEEW